jgi:hypothetical protein
MRYVRARAEIRHIVTKRDPWYEWQHGDGFFQRRPDAWIDPPVSMFLKADQGDVSAGVLSGLPSKEDSDTTDDSERKMRSLHLLYRR